MGVYWIFGDVRRHSDPIQDYEAGVTGAGSKRAVGLHHILVRCPAMRADIRQLFLRILVLTAIIAVTLM